MKFALGSEEHKQKSDECSIRESFSNCSCTSSQVLDGHWVCSGSLIHNEILTNADRIQHLSPKIPLMQFIPSMNLLAHMINFGFFNRIAGIQR